MKMRKQKLEMRITNLKKNNIVKEEPKEIESLNWFDKNNFKEILAIIDRNEFNYKNRIDEFKYIDIKYLVNSIRNNTISEIDVKKIKCIKQNKKCGNNKILKTYPWTLLNLFNDLLDIILTDKILE